MRVVVYLIQEGIADMVISENLQAERDICSLPVGHFSPNSTIRIEIVKEK